MKNKIAEIICVGTELLLGEVVNTNASYISKKLADIGIFVYHSSVVGDNTKRLLDALSLAKSRSDIIILSGGLGPTYDDMTKETLADFLGVKLNRDEKIVEFIRDYFKKTGRVMPENNKKQADIPEGGRALDNPIGTAPGIYINKDEREYFLLPGPPDELQPMVDREVLPILKSEADEILVSKNIYIIGMGESEVESELYSLLKESTNPTIAPYAKSGEMRLRVCAKAKNEELGNKMCDEVIEKIKKSKVGRFIYGIDVNTTENALFNLLKEKGMTISFAESLTGGMLGERFTAISGASAVFLGSAVTYANSAKERVVGVKKKTLDDFSAISMETAKEMAEGALKLYGSDIAISTTGNAGPTADKTSTANVGDVFVAVATKEKTVVKKFEFSPMRSRNYIRTAACSRAFAFCLEEIFNKNN